MDFFHLDFPSLFRCCCFSRNPSLVFCRGNGSDNIYAQNPWFGIKQPCHSKDNRGDCKFDYVHEMKVSLCGFEREIEIRMNERANKSETFSDGLTLCGAQEWTMVNNKGI